MTSRARQNALPGLQKPRPPRRKISDQLRTQIFKRDRYRCRICKATTELQIDHVIPVSKGGGNDEGNLQVLCYRCNSVKSDLLPSEMEDLSKYDLRGLNYYAQIPESLIYDKYAPKNALRIYGSLDRHANKKTGECYPGHRRIGKLTGSSRSEVQKCLAYLKDAGYIAIKKQKKGVNKYVLLPSWIWRKGKGALPQGHPSPTTGHPPALSQVHNQSHGTKENKQKEVMAMVNDIVKQVRINDERHPY